MKNALAGIRNRIKYWVPILTLFGQVSAEVYLLHDAMHYSLGRNNVVLGINSFDICIPLALAAFFSLVLIHRVTPISFRFQTKFFIVHGFTFVIALLFVRSLSEPALQRISPEWKVGIVFALTFFGFLSLARSWFPFSRLLRSLRTCPSLTAVAILGVYVLLYYDVLLGFVRPSLTLLTGEMVAYILNFFGLSVTAHLNGYFLTLWNPDFAGRMTQGCVGGEGIFFFISSYLILRCVEPRLNKRGEFLWVLMAGCVLMFVLNVFRVCTLFTVAVHLARHFGGRQAGIFYVELFHSHVGWVIYFIGLFIFFGLLIRRAENAKSRIPSVDARVPSVATT